MPEWFSAVFHGNVLQFLAAVAGFGFLLGAICAAVSMMFGEGLRNRRRRKL